jgi:hypothetical protein
MMATQMAAPMEATSTPSSVPASQIAQTGQQQAQPSAEPMPIVPLHAPSQYPNEPVTSGVDAGAGPSMASLGLQAPEAASYQSTKDYIQALARNSDASPALKSLAARFNGGF